MPSQTAAPELRRFLRRLPLSFVGAVVVWAVVRPVYNPALCAATQVLGRLFESPPASVVILQGGDAMLGRNDMRRDSGWLRFPLTQIHFNLVPFLALALALPNPLARGGWKRLLLALAILALAHVLSLLWQLKCLEAFSMGPWSRATYSDLDRDVLGGLRYFFDIPVTFALPLLLWVGSYSREVFNLVGLPAGGKR
jgi:hypothetical protein